jgi:O-acetyl-ADP-ribose deacetylase (regulator of RNase III)
MPLTIVRQDITKMKVDAIVNAANTDLAQGGGVCGAIFKAAGADKLQAACDKLSPIKTGEAVITPGFKLLAKYVIHAAGPVYRDGKHGEEELLRAAYTNSLRRAIENKCKSVAFPLISSGIYGYPKDEALRVATAAIRDFIGEHDIDVTLVVFDKAAFTVGAGLLGEVEAYIDENYVDEHQIRRRKLLDVERKAIQAEESIHFDEVAGLPPQMAQAAPMAMPSRLDDLVGNLDEPFSATLLRLIDAKGFKKDSEVYTRANIDLRLFSKIRSNEHYAPSKPTVLAFAVALRLTLNETEDLLSRAGFALSHSRKFDVVVEYFIKNGKYDIFEINNVLFKYDQPILGGC